MERQLVFGWVPGDDPETLVRRVRPFVNELGRDVNRRLMAQVFDSYAEVLDGMVASRFDLVTIGPAGIVEARRRGAEYQPLVSPVRAGRTTYRSIIIVRHDGSIASVDDLRGRAVAFVSPHSTSGFLAPSAALRERGLARHAYRSVFCGSHEAVIGAVLDGSAVAGAVYEGACEAAANREAASQTRVIVESERLPNEPISVSQRLERADPGLVDRIRRSLLRMHDIPSCMTAARRLWPRFDRFAPVEDPRVFDLVGTLSMR